MAAGPRFATLVAAVGQFYENPMKPLSSCGELDKRLAEGGTAVWRNRAAYA